MFYILISFYLFCILNSINSEFAANGVNYTDLIEKTDLYYIHPTPDNQSEETVISELKTPFSWKSPEIKVIIHGWNANRNHIAVTPLKYSYLTKGYDALFMADWGEASRIIYFDSRYFVQPIALKLAKLLEEFMKKNNIDPGKIHLIGHSLGAHISGNIGNYFNGTIGRITGLDPAGPLFESFVTDGLLPEHAKFVDCIHTCSPFLGQTIRRGHVDFYPNYGKASQPGCEILDLVTATACSHYRAPIYFAESVNLKQNFPSFSCSLKNILRTQCLPNKSKSIVYMGERVSKSAKGTYFLATNAVSPFGRRFPILSFNTKTEIIEPNWINSIRNLKRNLNLRIPKRSTRIPNIEKANKAVVS